MGLEGSKTCLRLFSDLLTASDFVFGPDFPQQSPEKGRYKREVTCTVGHFGSTRDFWALSKGFVRLLGSLGYRTLGEVEVWLWVRGLSNVGVSIGIITRAYRDLSWLQNHSRITSISSLHALVM